MTVESLWRPRGSWRRLWEQLLAQILPRPPTERDLYTQDHRDYSHSPVKHWKRFPSLDERNAKKQQWDVVAKVSTSGRTKYKVVLLNRVKVCCMKIAK